MIESIQLRILQGDPIVPMFIMQQLPPLFRGMPELHPEKCPDGCKECANICPTGAVQANHYGSILDYVFLSSMRAAVSGKSYSLYQ